MNDVKRDDSSHRVNDKASLYAKNNLSSIAPEGTELRVGDVVDWANDYGVEWTHKIIGFDGDAVHLNTDAYWFPHDIKSLSLHGKSSNEIKSRDLVLNNGQSAKYLRTDYWGKPVYELESKRIVCCPELNGTFLHSMTSDGEACTPLKQSYQP